MPELRFPWIEVSILLPMFGALWVHFLGSSDKALRHCVIICATTFALTVGELIDFVSLGSFEAHDHWLFLDWLFSRDIFVVDELSAFQLPLVVQPGFMA